MSLLVQYEYPFINIALSLEDMYGHLDRIVIQYNNEHDEYTAIATYTDNEKMKEYGIRSDSTFYRIN